MPALIGGELPVAMATSTSAAAATAAANVAVHRVVAAVLLLLAVGLTPRPAAATPITLTRDGQVIERRPPSTRTSASTSASASASTDPAVAAAEARSLLIASRREGDPRFAGRALARLAA